MKKIGGYLIIIGLALIILPYFGLTIMFLGEIEELGVTAAWAIKIGLIVFGAALYFMGNSAKTNQNEINVPHKETTE